MTLKAVIESMDGLDDSLKSLYQQRDDGKFALQVDGMVEKSKLSEFRDTNINLQKERDTMRAQLEKFRDVDPDKYKEAVSKLQEIEDKKLIAQGDLETLIAKRTDRMKTDYETQLNNLKKISSENEKKAAEYQSQLKSVMIDTVIHRAVNSVATPRKNAMTDIINRAKDVFRDVDPVSGNLIAKTPDGQTVYGKDGITPLQPKEWAETIARDAEFLFEPSTGGGATGGDKTSPFSGDTVSYSQIKERGGHTSDMIERMAAGTLHIQ